MPLQQQYSAVSLDNGQLHRMIAVL